jgi:pyruvate/2-oxoglutarate dehydrogenase complex dihydrolipoamide dehydrogenase (E3) component
VTDPDISDAESERTRRSHVRPPDWRQPVPASKYDLVVVGGGTAGLVCAMGGAGLGARVALVERHELGGDCLNTGCVPSKAMIRSARAVGELRRAPGMGVGVHEAAVDFERVMRRMRARRAAIASHDAALRLQAAGVDVFFGAARFVDRTTVIVGGSSLRFRRAVIATGSRPGIPSIPGLEPVSCLTNETILDLTSRPERLAVLGAGPVGSELAQAFARLGTDVTVFEDARQVLPRESEAAAAVVQRALERDGVRLHLGARVDRVERSGESLRILTPGGRVVCEADAILAATGRVPNVEGLGLDAAGVRADERGVSVNDRLQTSNRRIFASGDVCSTFKFTHAADAMSRLVLQNALFFGRKRASALVIPWVTFTDPEVAHVGVTAGDVAASGGRLSTITVPLAATDRAVVDDETEGFVAVHHERGRLRGCSIVGAHAGEMIAEAVYAITHGGTLAELSATIHPYPTTSEALRRAGDDYRRQALTAGVRRWLTRYFDWTR